MLLPIKAHYASVAMLELALRFDDLEPVSLRDIADEHEIPLPFLTQILQQLRAASLVTSTRGASGGYRLSRSPSKISLAEVVQSVCPTSTQLPNHTSPTMAHRTVAAIWETLDESIQKSLSDLSLRDLMDQHHETPANMFYI